MLTKLVQSTGVLSVLRVYEPPTNNMILNPRSQLSNYPPLFKWMFYIPIGKYSLFPLTYVAVHETLKQTKEYSVGNYKAVWPRVKSSPLDNNLHLQSQSSLQGEIHTALTWTTNLSQIQNSPKAPFIAGKATPQHRSVVSRGLAFLVHFLKFFSFLLSSKGPCVWVKS